MLSVLIDDNNQHRTIEFLKEHAFIMLSLASGNQISAGVLVRKDDDVRLTVAFHC